MDSAAACSPSPAPKYTVVTGGSATAVVAASVTFQPASFKRSETRTAAASSPVTLKTRTSAFATAAVVVVARVRAGGSADRPPELIAWNPTSRKIRPRNNSTITMARRGSPEESGTRSFIGVTVTGPESGPATSPTGPELGPATSSPSGELEAQASGGPGLLSTGPQPA